MLLYHASNVEVQLPDIVTRLGSRMSMWVGYWRFTMWR